MASLNRLGGGRALLKPLAREGLVYLAFRCAVIVAARESISQRIKAQLISRENLCLDVDLARAATGVGDLYNLDIGRDGAGSVGDAGTTGAGNASAAGGAGGTGGTSCSGGVGGAGG